MFVVIFLFLCVCSKVDALSVVKCRDGPIDDPCTCSTEFVFLNVNDTTAVGTTVAIINVSTEVTLDPCDYFNLTSGRISLVKDLRSPSCASSPQSCNLNCESNRQINLNIILIPIDENVPKFPQTMFTTQLYENASVSTVVFNFGEGDHKPFDKDCPADKSFNFFIEEGAGTEYFHIPSGATGEISLKKELDYETLPDKTFNITVGVTSSVNAKEGNPGFTSLFIKVLDVDDNDPQFEYREYDLKILEETLWSTPIPGEPLIRGFDKDRGVNQTILYSFEDYKNTSDFLQISKTDATFTVTKMVDREEKALYTMTIWCFQSDNREKKASAKLNIHVLDINDNLPVFDPITYNVTLVENAVGYVTTVTATDLDVGVNADVLYEIADAGPLEIDPNNGVVTVKTPSALNREDSPVITVSVKARDKDGNYSSATATIFLILLDVNDNSPQFVEEFFVFHVNSTDEGEIAGQVIANDADEENTPNANVTYSIQRNPVSHLPFIIDPLTGLLSIHGVYDRQTNYRFNVIACDNPDEDNDRRCSLAYVAVLYGRNVSFESYDIEFTVLENMPIGTIFGDVLPIHGDNYLSATEAFTVDVQSRMLRTNIVLDRESNNTYLIIIGVFQYKQPVGNISVTIHVDDDNDNVPKFTREEYFFSISTSIDNGQLIGTMNATDEDILQNANLTFSFQYQFIDLFTIDSITGDVMKSDQLKENTITRNSLYPLIAVVEDQGLPPLRSVIPVYVSSMEVGPDDSVGIPTTLFKDTLVETNIKEAIEKKLAEILGFDFVTIEKVDEASSLVYIKASVNGTDVTTLDLQRSLVNHWSPVQNMFRQYMVPLAEMLTSNTNLSTSEIALIVMSVVVFFGAVVAIIIITRQWDAHVKNTRLYDSLRRPSNMYDSQELRMNFSEEELPSRFSTFKGPGKRNEEITMDGSFGLGFVNGAFSADGEELNTPTTPTWSCNDTPRIPRWSTTDSLKDAMASLEELTNRLNTEDNISRVSNMSRSRRSVKSNKSDPQTPRSEVQPATHFIDGRTVPGYEDLVIKPPRSKDYADLNLGQGTVNGEPINGGHFDSGKNASDRLQKIIDANRIDDYENADLAELHVNHDLIEEESTAF